MSTTVEEIEKIETSKDKKDELLLDSLEIKGYRCFEHLTIEKLGRVNLIVGKNNVGKTALLEALWIYAQRGHSDIIVEILARRNEIPLPKQAGFSPRNSIAQKEVIWNIRHLFSERKDVREKHTAIVIRDIDSPEKKMTIDLMFSQKQEDGKTIWRRGGELNGILESTPYIVSFLNGKAVEQGRVREGFRISRSVFRNVESLPSLIILLDGLKESEISKLWDNVSITDSEQLVISSLKIIAKDLHRLSFISLEEEKPERVAVVKVDGKSERVSLKSLGEGMSRLLGIVLALVNCKNGMFIIDEIESGLHYSVLPDVWKLIFKTAKDLNVQVFATTHSKDCIEAFTQAAIDDEESDGMLIRLENKDGKIRAVNFNEDELETVERRNIEVR